MSQDFVTMMMKLIRDSIAEVQASAGPAPDRAVTRALAHLWSAHDELELCRGAADTPIDRSAPRRRSDFSGSGYHASS